MLWIKKVMQSPNSPMVAGSQAVLSAFRTSGVAVVNACLACSIASREQTWLRSSALRSIAVTVINSRAISSSRSSGLRAGASSRLVGVCPPPIGVTFVIPPSSCELALR
jgi:hypothetical protein